MYCVSAKTVVKHNRHLGGLTGQIVVVLTWAELHVLELTLSTYRFRLSYSIHHFLKLTLSTYRMKSMASVLKTYLESEVRNRNLTCTTELSRPLS